jgi:hypothetical protein
MMQPAEGTALAPTAQVIPLRRRERDDERGWAERYDRAAGRLVEGEVVAAARFLRPRGWRAFAGAVVDAPVAAALRATGRPRRLRLPEALLVAVTPEHVHLLRARTTPGCGPVPTAIGTLACWERARVTVTATPEAIGTRLTLAPRGGGRVELIGPPDALTARVVAALRLTAPELLARRLAVRPPHAGERASEQPEQRAPVPAAAPSARPGGAEGPLARGA